MRHAGMGIAIPQGYTWRGVTSRYTARPSVAARGWGRGIGGYRGALGASSATAPADMTFTLAESPQALAQDAIAAVIAASATARRAPIAAVRAFQSAYGHGLTVDGLYGPSTRAALIAVTGRSDIPAAAVSGSTSSPLPASVVATPDSSSIIPADTLAVGTGRPPWLVPVALAATAVLVLGGAYYALSPVRANRGKKRRARRGYRRVRRNSGLQAGDHITSKSAGAGTVVEVHGDRVHVRWAGHPSHLKVWGHKPKEWVARSSVRKA